MNAIRLFLILSAVLLGGCESDSYNALYGPAVVGTTVHDSMRRALTRHVWARPGTRLDDLRKSFSNRRTTGARIFLSPIQPMPSGSLVTRAEKRFIAGGS